MGLKARFLELSKPWVEGQDSDNSEVFREMEKCKVL